MNCRYCGQWNPDEALRCSFCANAKDALEDSTATPQRTRPHSIEVPAAPAETRLPNPLRVQGPEPEFRRALRLADNVWAIVVGVISVLVGLMYLLGRCH